MWIINNLISKNGINYYTFEPLNIYNNIVHGFSTRIGGTSLKPYATLNLGLHVGDKKEDVIKNRERFCNCLGFSLSDTVSLKQVHGNKIFVINEKARGLGSISYEDALGSGDGIITNIPGILLMTYYADCVPIYLYDPVTNSIGLAHAGWKGTVLKIAKTIVEQMSATFGAKPVNCIAIIGPSIGQCCYQVDNTVIEQVKKSFNRWNELFSQLDEHNAYLNLWLANKISLLESGLLNKNIHISNLCTSCLEDHFFSHRRDKGKTGRMTAAIAIKG